MYTLEDLSEKQTNRQGKGSNTRLTRSTDESITFTSVDIVAPGGTCCANDLTFKVEKGKRAFKIEKNENLVICVFTIL
jgi:hypothetical protein